MLFDDGFQGTFVENNDYIYYYATCVGMYRDVFVSTEGEKKKKKKKNLRTIQLKVQHRS